MVKAEGVSCGYGDKRVLSDIGFEIGPGEKIALVGPNGCGKTTLLKALCGLLPFEGSIRICGMELKQMTRKQIAGRVALLHQMSGVSFAYTVWDAVMLGRYVHTSPHFFSAASSTDRRVVSECLEKTGMLEQKDRLITELSGGQLQRVFLARTFAQEPEIILLDEPTNHLDIQYQIELVGQLREWTDQKGIVIGVFHDVNMALQFADRVMVMDRGSIRAFQPADRFDLHIFDEIYAMDVSDYMRSSLRRWETEDTN